MKDRIIIRTIQNMSYAGNVLENTHFSGEGIVLLPNASNQMEIFIPKNEIGEILVKREKLTYDDFIASK